MAVGVTRGSGPTYAVLLAGDHEQLGHAEVSALEAADPGGSPEVFAGSRVRLTPSRDAAERAVQAIAWGEHWTGDEASPEGIRRLARAVAYRSDGAGTAAVRVTRFGDGPRELHDPAARALGKALVDAGHAIDLTEPDVTVFAWIGEGRIQVGRLGGTRDRRYQDRVMEKRAHFHPVGLHPRLAATLVHLASVRTGGRILDPFCGTGGIVLEAALLGYDAWGSDIDARMVQGTYQTLADAGPEAVQGTVFTADVGDVPDLVEGIDAIVTDLPYGTASSTHDEPVPALYDRAFAAFARILAPGGKAVVGHADPALLTAAGAHGLEVMRVGRAGTPMVFSQTVHRSLTRHFAVLQRSGQQEPAPVRRR